MFILLDVDVAGGDPLPFYSQGQSNLKLIAVSFLTEFLNLPTKLEEEKKTD